MVEYHKESSADTNIVGSIFALAVRRGRRVKGQAALIKNPLRTLDNQVKL